MPAMTVAVRWIPIGGSRFSRAAIEIVDVRVDPASSLQPPASTFRR
jgi:hypothetical protein